MSSAPEAPAIRVADLRASRGAGWIGDGFRLYRMQPLMWSGIALGWLVISFGLVLVPLIGSIVVNLLQPVFFASFALAARRQLRGERADMGDLFLAFRGNLRALVNVGMIELTFSFAIILAITYLAGPVESPLDSAGTPNPEDIARVMEEKAWYILSGFALIVLVKAALWFAPPLIAFHGLSAMHAVRWSLYAALSNAGAMVTYFVALVLAYLVALLPWGLGLFIALPVMCLSTYTGYRDVFERE